MPLQTLPCRAFQRGFALGARLLPWRTPTVLSGAGSLLKLPDVFSREGASRPLVVASRRQCADERFLALRAALEGRVFAMQLRDETRARRDLWARAGEGTLRGQFLAQLKQKYDAADSDRDRETIVMAARWGLAALDHDEEVVTL